MAFMWLLRVAVISLFCLMLNPVLVWNLPSEQPASLIKPRTKGTPNATFLAEIETEPGLSWPKITITHAENQGSQHGSVGNSNTADESSASGGRLMNSLQRIQDRLTSMENIEQQLLRKLESFDYRITRLEVQVQEKSESLRTGGTELQRKLANVETELSRMETLMDVVREETTATRAATTELKLLIVNLPSTPSRDTFEPESSSNKMQIILAGLNNVRSIASNIKDELTTVKNNVTTLADVTKSIGITSSECSTKLDLRKSVTELKSAAQSPANNWRPLPIYFNQGSNAGPNAQKAPGLPRDCKEAMNRGAKLSGVQRIQPIFSDKPFFVYCDMETQGGGWTVIQNRFEGAVNFLREWDDYKNGFGNLATEFWLGLEKIYMLTNQAVSELLIEVTDFDLNTATAAYEAFAIGSEIDGYDLRLLGAYEGDAGDSLSYHASMKFSTADADQDDWPDGNCARDHTGGWWYRGCDTSNLNGQYLNGNVPAAYEYKGMYWYDYHGPSYSLMKSRMLIRPVANASFKPPMTRPTNSTTTTISNKEKPGKDRNKKKELRKTEDE